MTLRSGLGGGPLLVVQAGLDDAVAAGHRGGCAGREFIFYFFITLPCGTWLLYCILKKFREVRGSRSRKTPPPHPSC